jgi:aminoglycoside 6'-N-acetyltransferase I
MPAGASAERSGERLALEVREAVPADREVWCRLRTQLWPDSPGDHPVEIAEFFASRPTRQTCFLAYHGGRAVGIAEVGLRDYAEECGTSPVGYLEGIYVASDVRTLGVGRTLVDACERWARSRGCTEMASDRELTNDGSGAFHRALGFEETVRTVCYRKALA